MSNEQPAHMTEEEYMDRLQMPEHVDHRSCLHDFVSLDDGAVACTICYWVWEVEEGLE